MSHESPISLRGIPPDTLRLAQNLSMQTGLSMVDILRLAGASGVLVEITKVAPDDAGVDGGLEGAVLAKALRRHLTSAIDMSLEYGQHPYQKLLNYQQAEQVISSADQKLPPLKVVEEQKMFEGALADDLESLGLGRGLGEEDMYDVLSAW